jgi:hypothetical protein
MHANEAGELVHTLWRTPIFEDWRFARNCSSKLLFMTVFGVDAFIETQIQPLGCHTYMRSASPLGQGPVAARQRPHATLTVTNISR